MTQTHSDMQAQHVRLPEPFALPYRDAPTGEVVASEAALRALAKTRPWALLCAIGLFMYAVAGAGLGGWLVVLRTNRGLPNFPVWQFIVITTANLLFAPLALVGGFLAMQHHVAAGRAHNRRSSPDLERALVAQLRVWRWGVVVIVALFGFPVAVLFVAALMDVWP